MAFPTKEKSRLHPASRNLSGTGHLYLTSTTSVKANGVAKSQGSEVS